MTKPSRETQAKARKMLALIFGLPLLSLIVYIYATAKPEPEAAKRYDEKVAREFIKGPDRVDHTNDVTPIQQVLINEQFQWNVIKNSGTKADKCALLNLLVTTAAQATAEAQPDWHDFYNDEYQSRLQQRSELGCH